MEEFLKARQITHLFDTICTSCEVNKGKPAPDVYLKAAGQLGAEPSACLVFEDVPMGILAGKNAGMRVCAVDDWFSRPQDAKKRELADYLFTAMKTLPIRHTRYYNESWILPISRKEMEERGWNQVDFVYVSGDAYVDHPSFGHAIITRLLEAHGFRVGIIAQPDWKDKEVLHELESRGLDLWCRREIWIPWYNHYSVSKKRRQQDSYTPAE